jgi:hypothetical protein
LVADEEWAFRTLNLVVLVFTPSSSTLSSIRQKRYKRTPVKDAAKFSARGILWLHATSTQTLDVTLRGSCTSTLLVFKSSATIQQGVPKKQGISTLKISAMKEERSGTDLVESLCVDLVLPRSPQHDSINGNGIHQGGWRRGGGVEEECDAGLHLMQALRLPSREAHNNAMLDVSDIVDRLSHVQLSKASLSTHHLPLQAPPEARTGNGTRTGPSHASIQAQRVGMMPTKSIEKLAVAGRENGGGNDALDDVVEHTETTHDETLSVAEKCRVEHHDRHDNDESLEDVSIMTTGSFGNGVETIHFRHQWEGPNRLRRELSGADGEDDAASDGASGFSLDAMVGHSSCGSSVTWYEGSQIDEITVDEDDADADKNDCGGGESHEDVLVQCSSSGEEASGSDVEVIVYEDDETMFEWTSTESFFGDDGDDEQTRDNIDLEQSLAPSSSSASSCTSPLSSPPFQPQRADSLSVDRDI